MSIDPFAPEPADQPHSPSLTDHPSQPHAFDQPAPPHVILSIRLCLCGGLSAFTILVGVLVARALDELNTLPANEAIASYMVGAFFAIGMLAVVWPALGPGDIQLRAFFTFLLLLGICILFFISIGILADGDLPPPEFYLGAAVGILSAWAIPTFPLWCLRKGLGARFALAKHSDTKPEKQFSIGSLLGATGAVALFLGVVRAALLHLKVDFIRDSRGFLIFGFFVMAAFLICFMFYIAATIPRYVALAIAIAVLFTCLASHWELSLVGLIARGGPPFRPHFFWILNGASAFWTLIFALMMRAHGYRFQIGK